MTVDLKGNVGICGCDLWLPTKVGNLFQQTVDEILGSNLAQSIRASIGQGSYEYCNGDVCSTISMDQLIGVEFLDQQHQEAVAHPERWVLPQQIYISGDATCNLTCPSCRTKIHKTSEDQIEAQSKLGLLLKNNLFTDRSDQSITLHVSTSGEVFASPLLLEFLNSIEIAKFPNLKLWLQTNGLLAPKFWHKLGDMANRVDNITVTVDAARGPTYEYLRRGGRWEDILDSLEWIKNKKIQNNMSLHIRMVVQQHNIDQLFEFYELGQKYSANQVDYVRITNWGTYSEDEFKVVDVFDIDHPDRDYALSQIQQIKHLPNVWTAGGL